jgi:hypothetical protein
MAIERSQLHSKSLLRTVFSEFFLYNLTQMKFAKSIFYIAFFSGLLILSPLLAMFDIISRQDPPPITHPAFYYGFVTASLAWQLVFLEIAWDPIRYRRMMIPSVLEKFGYAAALTVLYLQHRIHPQDAAFGAIDALFGVLFIVAFLRTPSPARQ